MKETKSVFTIVILFMFFAFSANGQTSTANEISIAQLENCPLKGTPDCPYKIVDKEDNSAIAQLKDCPYKGTPDCPIVNNCPKKGQADCPFKDDENSNTSVSDAKIPSCCSKVKM